MGSRTTRAIKRRIHGIAWDFWLNTQRTLPLDDDEVMTGLAYTKPEFQISQTITRLAESMRTILPARSEPPDPADPDPYTESPHALHEAVADDFAYIKTVLTPRVVTLASNPTLVELLLRLEDHEEDWRSWTTLADEWGAPDLYAWRQATAALEVAAEILHLPTRAQPDALAGDDGSISYPPLTTLRDRARRGSSEAL